MNASTRPGLTEQQIRNRARARVERERSRAEADRMIAISPEGYAAHCLRLGAVALSEARQAARVAHGGRRR